MAYSTIEITTNEDNQMVANIKPKTAAGNTAFTLKYIIEVKRKNGICQIANGSVGIGHSAHPNIDASGSLAGMKKLYGWPKDGEYPRAFGNIYCKSMVAISDELDALAYFLEKNPHIEVKDGDRFNVTDEWNVDKF